MFSFFLIDYVVANNLSEKEIATWASIKSLVMVGGALVLLGMDQVMVRFPNQAKGILKRSLFQVGAITVIYTSGVFFLEIYNDVVWLFLAVFSLAVSTLVFGYFRSIFNLLIAQVVTNIWKLLFLIFLGLTIYFDAVINYALLFVVSITSTLILAYFLSRNNAALDVNENSSELVTVSEQHRLGFRFFISLMTLSLSLYLEQILLNSGGHTYESSVYFSHFAVILPPMMLFNGYLGFVLGPYVRKNLDKFDLLLGRYWWLFFLLAFLLGFIAYFFSQATYEYLLPDSVGFIPGLGACIAFVGVLRLLYILPSSYLGVVANADELNRFVIINVFGIFMLVISFYVLTYLTADVLFSIVLAGLINWLVRTAYGTYLVWLIWSRRI